MFCRLKSFIGRLSIPSFTGEQNNCPDSRPLFYRKTAVFSPALANLFYERLWTQHGGDVLRISGFFEDGDIERSSTRYESNDGDNRSRHWFNTIWDQVYRHADYVFVDAETWADASLIDARFVVRVNLLIDASRLRRIVNGTDDSSYIPSMQHLRARRTPLSGSVALTATETSAIQFCLHSVRENMKLLESPERNANTSKDIQADVDGSVIIVSPDKPTDLASSVKDGSPSKRRGRRNYRIEKRSPSTPISDYSSRREVKTKPSFRNGTRITPGAPGLSDFSVRKPTCLVKEISETEGDDDATLVADRSQMSKKDGLVDGVQETVDDTIYVASTSPAAILAANLARTKSEESVYDTECEQLEVEISGVEDGFVYLSRIRS
ncbi:hypothetical protein LIPSTDRAFT_60327 [Lipomyces starkeyi NRRL Y-11557]|uniref:Uncharacterized protein n=1 Tax=Lipomyces starkeyi NRRL Y-11557 TaxID=675824 RepID=A0A1E3QEU8_LIPST|nr:hypothetical protein LIPSTDRAFT_60327 [Lipomyces starkeyi NRRL Y-11557]